MKVHSMVYPQDREYIRNKVLVNFNVEEITNDETFKSFDEKENLDDEDLEEEIDDDDIDFEDVFEEGGDF